MDNKLKIAAFLTFCALVGVVTAIIYQTIIVPSIGTVLEPAQFDLYLDDMPLTDTSTIDWGEVEIGIWQFDNLTCINTGVKTLTIYMAVVDLPAGTVSTWAGHGLALASGEKMEYPLILDTTATTIYGPFSATYTFTGEA